MLNLIDDHCILLLQELPTQFQKKSSPHGHTPSPSLSFVFHPPSALAVSPLPSPWSSPNPSRPAMPPPYREGRGARPPSPALAENPQPLPPPCDRHFSRFLLEGTSARPPSPALAENPQPLRPTSDKLVASVAESTSALTLQEPEVTSSELLLDYISSEESVTDSDDDTDGEEYVGDLSLGSKILIRDPPKWYQVYFIRTDSLGLLHMYPDLGGPFQSLNQAECAISHHLAELQSQSVLKEKETYSTVDRLIHEHNYYPDGTPKRGPNSRRKTNPNEEQYYLVKALLDQYNDSKNLFRNLALELESLLRHKLIYGKKKLYYHFNFTTKTGNLFFAEVSQIEGEGAWKVTCCCMVDSNENGQCNTCRNDGCPDMKHPDNTDLYIGGRLNGYFQYGEGELSESDDDVEAEATRLRVLLKNLDGPDAMKRIYLRAMQRLRSSGPSGPSAQVCKEQENLSVVDRMIHNRKYSLDGTPSRDPNSPSEDEKLYLIQAILH